MLFRVSVTQAVCSSDNIMYPLYVRVSAIAQDGCGPKSSLQNRPVDSGSMESNPSCGMEVEHARVANR